MQNKNALPPLLLWMFGLVIVSLIFSFNTHAQELSLFEDIDADNEQSRRDSSPRSNDGLNSNDPILTLIGISRIGDTYSVILKDAKDKAISLRTVPDIINVVVTGYPGYSISEISTAGVNLIYPENSSCGESLAKGVRCLDDRVARLTLAKMEPLQIAVGNEAESTLANEEDAEAPINPFEAIARRSRNPESDTTENQQFRPRRINPEDVPAGMRVVSTPFGDRLVENE